MKARSLLLAAGSCILVGLAGLEAQKPAQQLLVLEWASKAASEKPPLAVLICRPGPRVAILFGSPPFGPKFRVWATKRVEASPNST